MGGIPGRAGRIGRGKADVIARSVADERHDEVVEGGADDFLEAVFVGRADFDVAVLGDEIVVIGRAALGGEDDAFGVAVPGVRAAAEDGLKDGRLGRGEAF